MAMTYNGIRVPQNDWELFAYAYCKGVNWAKYVDPPFEGFNKHDIDHLHRATATLLHRKTCADWTTVETSVD